MESFHYLGLLTAWSLSPFSIAVLFVLVGLSAWYLDAVMKARAKGRTWSNARVVAFLSGAFAIEYALGGPVSVYVMHYFTAHIAQHLLLMIVAPGLLSLSAPVTLALQTARPSVRRLIDRFLHSRFLHVITFPLVVFALYYGVMWWFFTSTAVGYAMAHMWLMDILNVLFFAGGVLFWWPLVGKDTILHWRLGFGGRVFSLAIGIPFETFLGITISSNRVSLAPKIYSLSDWHAGGQVLWGAGEAMTTVGLAIVIGSWIASEDRAHKRMNASSDAYPLSSRGEGMPKEYYWAQQIIARTPVDSPVHQEALTVLKQIAREQAPAREGKDVTPAAPESQGSNSAIDGFDPAQAGSQR
ncbi:MAG: cytochrome c oxidase assembly protein [Ferrimicrobium sp.]|uniref:cytochrome c oxidase assembly protein n=1 Tax=Ferrimicrobium sp. TaxID=2926050 RepID=UPI0023F19F04|nr:cytochrome c oxidase assembly protein [Ferrimicrobium sp.]